MSFIPTLSPFYDSTENTPYYWLVVTIPEGENYEIVSHEHLPSPLFNSNNVIEIQINVKEFSNGSKSIMIDFINHLSHPDQGDVVVSLIDDTGNQVGSHNVGMEEAQEQMRPVFDIN